jgi:hypothetical protein
VTTTATARRTPSRSRLHLGRRYGEKAACSDGIDNDEDGKTDFPGDPGCTSNDDVAKKV